MEKSRWEPFGALYEVETLEGYGEQDIQLLRQKYGALPKLLEEFYRAAAKTQAFHQVQDQWITPQDHKSRSWLQGAQNLMLVNENQGVCNAVVLQKDLEQPNPPVYVSFDDQNWTLCARSLEDFLSAMLCYQSVFSFSYSPECFFWLTEEERDQMDRTLTRLPFELESWMDAKITLYQNRPENMAAVMECADGELQMLYGGATEEAYQALYEVLKDVGEEM